MSNKREKINGIVLEAFSGGKFSIELKNGKTIRAYLSGKMRIHKIKILPGDTVTVELSNYDDKKGRIIYRK